MKVLGADFELSNSMETPDCWDGDVVQASRRLLEEIPRFPRCPSRFGTVQELGRGFLASSGSSAYIDSNHLEINLPEHTRAQDHAAILHAGLRVAREAQVAASRKLSSGGRIHVSASVSDAQQAWGSHLNVMSVRELLEALTRKPVVAGFLATHLATSTLFTGQGKVGAGNRRHTCDYQLSQRADWFEEFSGVQTTHRRPLINLRDEPLAGNGLARIHIIYFDNVLCPIANYLKAGTTQLVVAMAEAGWASPQVLLDDPLTAALEVSRDLSLKRPLAMAQRGRAWTAIEVQKELAELAGEFIASGQAGNSVPGAEAIVACWREVLELLEERAIEALAPRLDWALKFLLLDRQRGRRGLAWESPEIRYLDQLYSSLDPQEGLFWHMAAAGQVAAMPGPDVVDRFFREPPDDTRAYLRAHVLRRFGEHVVSMDWDEIDFLVHTDRYWSSVAKLSMPDPTDFGRSVSEPLLERCESLHELIEATGDAHRNQSPVRGPLLSEAQGGNLGTEPLRVSESNP